MFFDHRSSIGHQHREANQAHQLDKTALLWKGTCAIIVSSLLVARINSIGQTVARCISGFSADWNNRAYLCIVVVNPLIAAWQITYINRSLSLAIPQKNSTRMRSQLTQRETSAPRAMRMRWKRRKRFTGQCLSGTFPSNKFSERLPRASSTR